MKINKNIIKELNDYLEEFNLTEIEYTEKDIKVKVSKSKHLKNIETSESKNENMPIKLKNRINIKRILHSRMSLLILCLWAFSEAFIFPIPPDPFLIALVIANRKKFFLYCMLCTAFSVLGGITGYYIGFIFWDEIGVHITEYFALTDQINSFKELYNENGSLAVFIAGVSPIPYKLVTIISGISSMNFFYFCLFSLFSRGLRFLLIGFLIFWFGSRVQSFIENRLGLLTLIIIVGALSIFLLLSFL